jgi:hypothetical protein
LEKSLRTTGLDGKNSKSLKQLPRKQCYLSLKSIKGKVKLFLKLIKNAQPTTFENFAKRASTAPKERTGGEKVEKEVCNEH